MTIVPADRTPAESEIGRTGRGLLRRAGDRIVRVIDPRLCDERFRTAVAEVRGRQPRQSLRIVADGPASDGYRIEYATPEPYRTLGEALGASAGWPEGLALVALVCDAVDVWHRARLSRMGVDVHSVVVTGEGAGAVAWLLPCPPVQLSSPYDLAGTDPAALAAIAPDVVRGMVAHGLAEDAYAIGTLAALAAGCPLTRAAAGDAERLEVQARGALLVARADRSRLEPALHDTARTRRLFATIQHYRDPVADARPSNAADLRQALAAVADTTALAQDLRESASAVALDLLTSYPGAGPDDRVRRHRLAAGISAREGDDVGALDHLDAAVVLSPDHVDVRRERGEVLWRRWNTEPDTWRTRLLAELRYLQELSPSRHAELWARQAAVHEHEHDDGAALRALAVAADRDVRNVGLLVRTARCWQRLEATDNVEAVCRVARHRIAGFRRRGEMGEEEARRWLDELDGICQSTPDLS